MPTVDPPTLASASLRRWNPWPLPASSRRMSSRPKRAKVPWRPARASGWVHCSSCSTPFGLAAWFAIGVAVYRAISLSDGRRQLDVAVVSDGALHARAIDSLSLRVSTLERPRKRGARCGCLTVACGGTAGKFVSARSSGTAAARPRTRSRSTTAEERRSMMRWIVGSSLKFRLLVVAAAAALMVFGIAQLRDMPVDVLPEFTPPTVEVQTEALGLSAEEVEQLITVPLEQDLLERRGVPRRHPLGVGSRALVGSCSSSSPAPTSARPAGGGGAPDAGARAAARLEAAADAPAAVVDEPGDDGRRSRARPSRRSSCPCSPRWTIEPRLMGVPGVANVAICGQREQQLQVQVDPEQLRDAERLARPGHRDDRQRALGLAAELPRGVDARAPAGSSTPPTSGSASSTSRRSRRRTTWRRFERRGHASLQRLGDVANVVEDHQPLIGDAVLPRRRASCSSSRSSPRPTRSRSRGTSRTAHRRVQPGLAGVEFDTTFYRPATYIDESIDNLDTRADHRRRAPRARARPASSSTWRTALIALVVIPLSLVAAGLVLYAARADAQRDGPGGLVAALGLVVDDAIVGRRQRRCDGCASTQADGDDVSTCGRRPRRRRSRCAAPSSYATLIVALALLPVFVLEGMAGAFLPPLVARVPRSRSARRWSSR